MRPTLTIWMVAVVVMGGILQVGLVVAPLLLDRVVPRARAQQAQSSVPLTTIPTTMQPAQSQIVELQSSIPLTITTTIQKESADTLLGNPMSSEGPPMEVRLGNCYFSGNTLYCGAQTGKPQSWTGVQSFSELHTTTYAPTLTNDNYNVSMGDCGKVLQIADSNAATVTVPNMTPPNNDCVIAVEQTGPGSVTPRGASGATVTPNVNNFTSTKGVAAFITLVLRTPSASASVWDWTGDGQ